MARHRVAPARAAAPAPAPATPPAPSAPPARSAPPSRRATTGGHTDLGAALPRQGLTEQHPSGPLPRSRRRRDAAPRGADDPATSPLDLAAIALAAAGARRAGLPATGTSPAADGPVARTAADDPREVAGPATGGTPRPAYPAAVPSALAPPTPAHPVPAVHGGGRPGERRRVPLPTRTAGALALVGALAGGGVAVIGGGTMMAADRTPDTGALRAADDAGGAGTGVAAASLTSRGAGTASAHAPDRAGSSHATPGSGRHRADGTRGDADGDGS